MGYYGMTATVMSAVGTTDPRYLTDGEHTIAPESLTASVTFSSGQLLLTYFTSLKSETTGKIHIVTGGTAASGISLGKIGLYTLDGSGNGALIATSANVTTLGNTANTKTAVPLVSAYPRSMGTRYAIGILFIGTTMPTLVGAPGDLLISAMAPRRSATMGLQLDLPGSFLDSLLTQNAARPYAALTS